MVIKYVMWGLLIGSSLLLVFKLFRFRYVARSLSVIGVNIVFAALMLYILNLLTPYTHIIMPINYMTLAVATILGIPGVLLLVSLKLVLL
jgi:inhibitor of the pro-sigma K processing machinery